MSEALAATRAGAGPRMLLLHGIGSSRTAWGPMIADLGSDFACIAPDLPGYGDSPDARGATLEDFVRPLAALCAREATHVVGVSFGALVALALARGCPGLVGSLVLADATLGRAWMPADERASWLEGRHALADTLAERADGRARQIAAPGADPRVVAAIAAHMRRARPAGYRAVAEAIAATDAEPWLPAIHARALVVYGAHDGVTGRAVSERLARGLPDARLRELAGAGHAPHVECPEMFAHAIRTFLPNS